jgi:hypothetical protein
VQREHGHLQELIVQNFRAKAGTVMAHAPEPPLDEQLWTIAVARLLFGSTMSIQAPPNLQPAALESLACSGINDWGGVSPVTPDFVNPEAPWPHLADLERRTQDAGRELVERLAIVPAFALRAVDWVDAALRPRVLHAIDAFGYVREDRWHAGATLDGTEAPSVPGRRETSSVAAKCRARYAATPARRLGSRRGADRQPVRGAWHRVCGGGLGRGCAAPVGRWRSRELRRQPQHQLHEHLHLSLWLLRILEGPQRPQPARPRLPDRSRGNRDAHARGLGARRHRGLSAGRHPSRSSPARPICRSSRR